MQRRRQHIGNAEAEKKDILIEMVCGIETESRKKWTSFRIDIV